MDLPSRRWKAEKIERLLRLDRIPGPIRLLEIGTGSGGIAAYFGAHPSGRFDVDAVDVADNRLVREGFRYTTVVDTRLPFADGSFDVVLSNHVIEHVGDDSRQSEHLRELRRVLRHEGVAYLAVPNRWMLVEPHYQVAFLSWLPERWRTPYLRFRGKGREYDCRPLTAGQAGRLLAEVGFRFEQQCGEALRVTFELERPGSWLYRWCLRRVPDAIYRLLGPAFPTLIYRLRIR